jgi:hypothetical protein
VSFTILVVIVSLFGDATYDGTRAVTGPYLYQLGASYGVISSVAGIGEFLGYSLPLASDIRRLRADPLYLFAGTCWPLAIGCCAYHSGTGGESDKESSQGYYALLCYQESGERLSLRCS